MMRVSAVTVALVVALCVVGGAAARRSEVRVAPGHTRPEDVRSPQPYQYIDMGSLPKELDCTLSTVVLCVV